MRSKPRRRHEVSPGVLAALSPIFRHSLTRDAWVLRGVGRRVGPVLTERMPGGRFVREREAPRADDRDHRAV